jgi:hypothetical protein
VNDANSGEPAMIFCPLCDTGNTRECTACEECGHDPHKRPGEDDCNACRILGDWSEAPVTGDEK